MESANPFWNEHITGFCAPSLKSIKWNVDFDVTRFQNANDSTKKIPQRNIFDWIERHQRGAQISKVNAIKAQYSLSSEVLTQNSTKWKTTRKHLTNTFRNECSNLCRVPSVQSFSQHTRFMTSAARTQLARASMRIQYGKRQTIVELVAAHMQWSHKHTARMRLCFFIGDKSFSIFPHRHVCPECDLVTIVPALSTDFSVPSERACWECTPHNRNDVVAICIELNFV